MKKLLLATAAGALLAGAASAEEIKLGVIMGFLAVVFATINVVGGYVVTNRMLQMFKGSKK